MHFAVSNLFYFLQVDVVDAEFAQLGEVLADPDIEFGSVARACRTFLASVVRHSMVDNSVVSDAIDSVLHLCIRFLCLCKLLMGEEAAQTSGGIVVVPPEEFDALYTEFTTQLAYLIHMVKRVEGGSQGFLFRLDFNGFMSGLQLQAAQSTQRSNSRSAGRVQERLQSKARTTAGASASASASVNLSFASLPR